MAKLHKTILKDKIELCDNTGAVVDTIDYEVNVMATFTEVQKIRGELAKLRNSNDNFVIGDAYIRLMKVIFGEDKTQRILDFYELTGDYSPLVVDFGMMFVTDILPAYAEYGKRLVELRKALKK